MISKIRILGLTLIAIAATSAFAVPAAQAGSIDVGIQPAVFFGSQEAGQDASLVIQKTGSPAGQNEFPMTCQSATTEGTTTGLTVSEATATATYSGCTAFGVASQVLMNGCKFTITGSGQPANTSVADVAGCTSGKTIEAKTAICTLKIGEQTGLSHLVSSQLNAQQLTLAATISGVKVQQVGAACPDGNLHTGTNSKLSSNTVELSKIDQVNQTVTKHSHQYQELGQTGAQTTVQST